MTATATQTKPKTGFKIVTDVDGLQNSLQNLSGAVGFNTTIHVLESVLFSVEGDKLTLIATDLETTMVATTGVVMEQEGAIAIPFKILMDLLKTLPNQPIAIEVNPETNIVSITSLSGKYKIAAEPGEGFFELPEVQADSTIVITTAQLEGAFAACKHAISTDELRPSMTGVYMESSRGELVFVATDAHVLVRHTIATNETATNARPIILPRKSVGLVNDVLKGMKSEEAVQLHFDKSDCLIEIGNYVIKARLIDARYPDFRVVIPTTNTNRLQVNKKDLQNAIKRIAIFSNKTTYQIVLDIKGNTLSISAQDIDFSSEGKETLACEYEGADMEIALNGKFVLNCLNALDAEEVVFELGAPSRAALIVPSSADEIEGEETVMLVMPLMLSKNYK